MLAHSDVLHAALQLHPVRLIGNVGATSVNMKPLSMFAQINPPTIRVSPDFDHVRQVATQRNRR